MNLGNHTQIYVHTLHHWYDNVLPISLHTLWFPFHLDRPCDAYYTVTADGEPHHIIILYM